MRAPRRAGSRRLHRDDQPQVRPVEEGDELRGEEDEDEVAAQRLHRLAHPLDHVVVALDRAGADAVGHARAACRRRRSA